MSILKKTDYKRSTWKNGLGFTDEIAIYPPGASLAKGDFLWRLSSAQIEKASSFSMFPAHERVLVVLKGDGIRMAHTFEEGEPEDVNDVPALYPYEFPGDIKSRCELIGGPITDFSVFTRTGEVAVNVSVEKIQLDDPFNWQAEGKWNFVFMIEGSVETRDGLVGEGETYSTGPTEVELRSGSAQSVALLVSLSSFE
jgi:environmental stress-induced protein Ves